MSTPSTTLYDTKLNPIITETPDSVSIGESISQSGQTSSTETSSNTIMDSFSSSYTFYFLLFLISTVLGINIFAYLGYLTENVIYYLRPLIFIGITNTSTISKDIVNTSAEGTKAGTDIVAGTINSAIDTTSNVLTQSPGIDDDSDDDDLEEDKVSNYNKLQKNINQNNKPSTTIPEPDDATSSTQKSQGKSGYCYIGEDRGFRSCININEGDTCMSGDIFPTEEICVNPSLREGTEKYN